jgi:hypothetical protein
MAGFDLLWAWHDPEINFSREAGEQQEPGEG